MNCARCAFAHQDLATGEFSTTIALWLFVLKQAEPASTYSTHVYPFGP